ncbi:hypothetical protein SUGI_1032650 [Cryptomeria japonica]|nr:hypothetical protein SUGI_1032650 [Cryptomeria japonica]
MFILTERDSGHSTSCIQRSISSIEKDRGEIEDPLLSTLPVYWKKVGLNPSALPGYAADAIPGLTTGAGSTAGVGYEPTSSAAGPGTVTRATGTGRGAGRGGGAASKGRLLGRNQKLPRRLDWHWLSNRMICI